MSQIVSGPVVKISEDPNRAMLRHMQDQGDGLYLVTMNSKRIVAVAKVPRGRRIEDILAPIQGDGDGKAVETEVAVAEVPAAGGRRKK